MDDLKTRAIHKLARQLKNLNCEFMIVPEAGDPVTNGNFTHYKKVPHGALTVYVKPFIDPLAPGDTVDIPIDEYAPESLRSTVSAYCSRIYGKGSHMTHLDIEKGVVSVLCLDREEPVEDDDQGELDV